VIAGGPTLMATGIWVPFNTLLDRVQHFTGQCVRDSKIINHPGMLLA